MLSRLFYAFPRIREVWNSCPGSGTAAAIKTHLAKYIGLIEEERAIVPNSPYGHRRLEGSIVHFFLNSPSCIATLLRLLFGRLSSSGLLTRKATLGSLLGAIGQGCRCVPVDVVLTANSFLVAFSRAPLTVNLEIEWMRHVPIGTAALGVHTSSLPPLPVMLPSPPALRHDGHLDSATTLLRQSAPWLQRACVLCGYGDNSVQHWMSSCCLGVAGSLLLGCSWRFSHWFPQAHWPRTQSARCYALEAGARAIIRQRGGLVAKHGDPPAAAPLDLLHIACFVATCALELA